MTRSGMMYEATRILGEGAFGQVYEATSAGSKTLEARGAEGLVRANQAGMPGPADHLCSALPTHKSKASQGHSSSGSEAREHMLISQLSPFHHQYSSTIQASRKFPTSTPGFRSPEMLNGLPYGTATDVWSLGNLLWELFTGMPLHRELETGTSKYNVRVNVRTGKGMFPFRSAIDSMLSRMDDARPSTNDLLSDATILDSLFNLWRTESLLKSGRSLEPDSCLDKGVPLLSRVQHAVDHASGQRQRYDTAVASLVAEDSDTSPDSTTTVFRFRHIKLG
ncbi:uncharacterized protein PSANT_06992 [Moesziomyces antarcticus]|uniref:non-specific serine/threonine protein kinase n=2 Tax=Pseudozyma antarctica TaxID=84753 RepID=A0A5C3FZS0_PSEA2|nr:uncharacterized protein PSANT_06992 [Moesziomyces antarcticus]